MTDFYCFIWIQFLPFIQNSGYLLQLASVGCSSYWPPNHPPDSHTYDK